MTIDQRREAFSVLGGPVETEGDPQAGRLLKKLFDVDRGLARALTHGFHNYSGRMHPSMARGAIAALSKPGTRVLDPFCGSGTVLVEAMAAGRIAIGVDASPLAILIARVRSTLLGDDELDRMVELAQGIAEEAALRARKRIRPQIPVWATKEKNRFSPHIAFELYGLRDLIGETAEDAVGWALRASLSSILVKFMQTGPRAAPGADTRRLGRGVPSHFYARRVEELAASLRALTHKVPVGTPTPDVTLGDARKISRVPASSIDLVVSSPPYAGVYDYQEQHEVCFEWLELPQARFTETQVGARGKLSSAHRWRTDREAWMGEMARSCRSGAHVVLVVGDGVVGGQREDAALATFQVAQAKGFIPLARASQSRPTRDRRLHAIFAGLPRREHVLLLRRE
jgi:SAM-dependent methyltransferase